MDLPALIEDARGGRLALFRSRSVYLLAALPLLADRLKTGRWMSDALTLTVDAVLGGVIVAIIALLRRARRRERLIDGLRKTMNEAIIHDLKNPMTSIMACLSCLRHDAPGPELQGKLLRLAEHSCRSQMALLETLVDTSRMEQGELAVRREPFSVQEFLADVLDDARGAASYLGVELRETIAKDIPADLQADAELLRRVLANLIHNALKYTPAGGSVCLDIRMLGGRLHFAVTDTGIGIGPKHLERLFGKYYRIEGSDQSMRRGSGLGLYFCRLAVEAHGGTIRVRSEIDKGTTISFDIPGGVQEVHGS